MIGDILRECRDIVERHHPNTKADLIGRIDQMLIAADPGNTMIAEADLERIALRAEIPISTVARVLSEAQPVLGARVEARGLAALTGSVITWSRSLG